MSIRAQVAAELVWQPVIGAVRGTAFSAMYDGWRVDIVCEAADGPWLATLRHSDVMVVRCVCGTEAAARDWGVGTLCDYVSRERGPGAGPYRTLAVPAVAARDADVDDTDADELATMLATALAGRSAAEARAAALAAQVAILRLRLAARSPRRTTVITYETLVQEVDWQPQDVYGVSFRAVVRGHQLDLWCEVALGRWNASIRVDDAVVWGGWYATLGLAKEWCVRALLVRVVATPGGAPPHGYRAVDPLRALELRLAALEREVADLKNR